MLLCIPEDRSYTAALPRSVHASRASVADACSCFSARATRAPIAPEALVGVLRALADDTRLRALRFIAERPRSTQELAPLVGLKPTYGRVSKAGVLPLSWLFDHVGPLTHTVEDMALILQVVAGYDAADFSTVPIPFGDYATPLTGDIRGLRAAC